ncbi:hypothetical protein BHE90_017611, partial [Fusarium euwallaceae]
GAKAKYAGCGLTDHYRLIGDLTQSRETECVRFGRNGSSVTVVVCGPFHFPRSPQ